MSDMRAALSAARDAGDITLKEYLDELRTICPRTPRMRALTTMLVIK